MVGIGVTRPLLAIADNLMIVVLGSYRFEGHLKSG
jgi:hypothetical protein